LDGPMPDRKSKSQARPRRTLPHDLGRTNPGCAVAALASLREVEAASEAAAVRAGTAAQVGAASSRV